MWRENFRSAKPPSRSPLYRRCFFLLLLSAPLIITCLAVTSLFMAMAPRCWAVSLRCFLSCSTIGLPGAIHLASLKGCSFCSAIPLYVSELTFSPISSALVALLWPIALALQKSPLLPFINHVLLSAALLAVSSISCRKLWTINRNTIMLEWIAVGLIYLRLMLLALMIGETGTLFTFAIVALIGINNGLLLKYKSYFFSSIVALIISLLYNRRHMWIELPWWFYLVIDGFTLIAIASVAEWTRQDKLRRTKLNLAPRESLVHKVKHYLNAWR